MRNGDIKAEAYAAVLLDRCQALAELNAFITLDRQRVLEDARAADLRRAAGETPGALHGLPLPVKDSIDTADYRTTSGTNGLREFHPRNDAAVMKPLRAAGALVLGKTNIREMSYGWTSNNQAFGPVRNPYDAAASRAGVPAAPPRRWPRAWRRQGSPRTPTVRNCASLPGLVLPGGLTTDGLPVGIEFDAPIGKDRELLGLGFALEKALRPIPAPGA